MKIKISNSMSLSALYNFGNIDGSDFLITDTKADIRPDNILILGASGSGKAHHPWDCLNVCSCGTRPLLMSSNGELYYCGQQSNSLVYVSCPKCGKATEKADIDTVIDYWNNQNPSIAL